MKIKGKAPVLDSKRTIGLKDWLQSKKNDSLIGIRLGSGTVLDQASIKGDTYLLVKEEDGYEIYMAMSTRRYVRLKGRRMLIHKSALTDYNNWRLRSTFEIEANGSLSHVFYGPRSLEFFYQRPSRTKMLMKKYQGMRKQAENCG